MTEREGLLFLETHYNPAVIGSIRDAFSGELNRDTLLETLMFDVNAVINGDESWASGMHPMAHVPEKNRAKLMELAEAQAQVESDASDFLDWLGSSVKDAIDEADPLKHNRPASG